jgi:hypothetical protein
MPGPASANFDFNAGRDPANGAYLGCSDQAGGMNPYVMGDNTTYENLDPFTVTAGESVFIVVDGYQDGSLGEFWLHAELN